MTGWSTVRRSPDNHSPHPEAPSWWRDAVFYEVDLRSFADSDGDGLGDLDGIRDRLGYLELLGVDALWLTAVPMTGIGPAISDPHEAAGVLESFELLATEAHDCDLRLVIDVGADVAEFEQPRSRDELAETLRFWIDRGADGFRVTPMTLHDDLQDAGATPEATSEIRRMIRAVVEEYPERVVGALENQRSGGWHLDFHLGLADTGFDAGELREAIGHGLSVAESLETRPTWMTAGHGRSRQVTRYGGGDVGVARARAMALVTLALPGVICLDSGEELGLPEIVPPGGTPTPGTGRIPMPWEEATARPPLPEGWTELTVETQLEDPSSTLSLYREALETRRTHTAFTGDNVEWYGAPTGCFAFRRGGGVTCALNTSEQPVPLPPGEVLLVSGPLEEDHLPPDTAVWLV